ncbi:GNAT family N-acetyltransferase [uncultured Odoribacter sp.]|uniref:GNAT family N-acetyltransferase n=1 Tax=uncultured Odoribacter sp. TaxID=876416 RepID=UPI0026350006|nr:GNAT family N-acetyltransferase [uncultured Odoribacter sp.]
MVLKTERLEITLLTPSQLKLWIEDIPALNKELNCTYKGEPMEGFFLEIVKKQLRKAQTHPTNYLFYSFFFLIRKTDRVVVGSADFKNLPNKNGEVEIGYGLGKTFEHKGYMTEAVKAICEFAVMQSNVFNVIAETEAEGFASQRILERCGFKKYKQAETIWWRL